MIAMKGSRRGCGNVSRYRGQAGRGTTISRMHEAVMIMQHKAYERGEIPIRPFSEYPIHCGAPDWSWIINPKPEAITEPDLVYFFDGGVALCVYFDGYHHQSSLRSRRDQEIDQRLEASGNFPLRLQYRNYTKGRAKKFNKRITETVKELAKKWLKK